MVASLFTTHFLVTTTPLAMVQVDLVALVGKTGITERTLSLVLAQARKMSKAVCRVGAAAVQERLGQTHRVTAV